MVTLRPFRVLPVQRQAEQQLKILEVWPTSPRIRRTDPRAQGPRRACGSAKARRNLEPVGLSSFDEDDNGAIKSSPLADLPDAGGGLRLITWPVRLMPPHNCAAGVGPFRSAAAMRWAPMYGAVDPSWCLVEAPTCSRIMPSDAFASVWRMLTSATRRSTDTLHQLSTSTLIRTDADRAPRRTQPMVTLAPRSSAASPQGRGLLRLGGQHAGRQARHRPAGLCARLRRHIGARLGAGRQLRRFTGG